MMTSDEKTLVPSLIDYINSDLFTLENISTSVILQNDDENSNSQQDDVIEPQWEAVINLLPLRFYQIIESYPNMYTIEEFDTKYRSNPKLCAYDRYNTTNMWRPLMILNRCPTISRFDFKFIRYYNIKTFSRVLSVLISRVQQNE